MLNEQRRQWWKGLKRLPSLKCPKGNSQGAEAIRVERPKRLPSLKRPKGNAQGAEAIMVERQCYASRNRLCLQAEEVGLKYSRKVGLLALLALLGLQDTKN
jgi:hypothetical protein